MSAGGAIPGLTPAALQQRIDARISDEKLLRAIDADLDALSAIVPPAVLRQSSTRTLLLRAMKRGPGDYADALAAIRCNDASALLGGPIADAEHTSDGLPIVPGQTARETQLIEKMGVPVAKQIEIARKYGLGRPENGGRG